jgi:hypothetical protein
MGQISLLLWSWIETTRDFARGRLWGPFLALALVEWGVILLLTQFHRSIFAPIMVPVLRLIGGDKVLHYPTFYLALPQIYSQLGIVLDALVSAWFLGAAFLLFWQADHPAEPQRGAFSRATANYGKLVCARLPLTIALVAMLVLVPRLLGANAAEASGSTQRLARYGSFMGGVLLESIFLYAPLAILVERRSVGGAIRRSVSLAAKMPVATIGVVIVPALVELPVSALFRRTDKMVLNMSPEVVAWALVLSVTAYRVASFFIVGACARLFRIRTEGAAGA